jgi:hypothetical protein
MAAKSDPLIIYSSSGWRQAGPVCAVDLLSQIVEERSRHDSGSEHPANENPVLMIL